MEKFETLSLKEKLTAGICTEMEGKMEGMWSMSTSCNHNPLCLRNQKIAGSICEKCYAETLMKMRKALDAKGERNAELLTKEVIRDENLPDIRLENTEWFRFEAFGDIYNETHLENYVNIAKHNPEVRFTLWTKNYKDAYNYFSKNKCPDNMTLILSSLFINKPVEGIWEKLKSTGSFEEGQLKIFTVYNYKFLKENPEVKINCGSRACKKCSLCYRKNNTVHVNEILKSDRKKVDDMLNFRDKEKRSEGLDKLLNYFG